LRPNAINRCSAAPTNCFVRNPTLAKPRVGPELLPLLRSWLSYQFKVRTLYECGVFKYVDALSRPEPPSTNNLVA
jgi:hypothetical protein